LFELAGQFDALSTAELASSSFSSNVFSFGILPSSHRSIGRAQGKRSTAGATRQ